MNKQVIDFMKDKIKEGLKTLPEGHQMLFKRMYSHGNLDASIDTVVDNMPEEKFDWALTQIDNSHKKLKEQHGT